MADRVSQVLAFSVLSTRRYALVFAWASALVSCCGTQIVGMAWREYSPVSQTVSTLAAITAPTRTWMNAVLVVTAASLAALAVVVPAASRLGRILLWLAATGVMAAVLLPFPAPDVDTGPHTAAVTVAMVMVGFAPLAMCAKWRRGNWEMRLLPVVLATAVLVVLGFTFLGHWLHKTPVMGLIERIFIAAEMACLVWVVHRGTASAAIAQPRRSENAPANDMTPAESVGR